MKKLKLKSLFLIVAVFLITSMNVKAQISVDTYGDVELVKLLYIKGYYNTTPQIYPKTNNNGYVGLSGQQFYHIRGQYHYATTVLLTSDKRFKENISQINNSMDKILQLEGKKYDFIMDETDFIGDNKEKEKRKKMKKNHLGFIAQDVESIIPEAVVYEEDEDRYYLNYDAFIPVLVEAFKEQQLLIEGLTAEVKKLGGNPKIKSAQVEPLQTALLEQNIPNPFSTSTEIEMYIPTSVSSAKIYLYNMQGVQIETFDINERKETNLIIDGFSLNAGMYLYSLITDGKEVDTKKMILTR